MRPIMRGAPAKNLVEKVQHLRKRRREPGTKLANLYPERQRRVIRNYVEMARASVEAPRSHDTERVCELAH